MDSKAESLNADMSHLTSQVAPADLECTAANSVKGKETQHLNKPEVDRLHCVGTRQQVTHVHQC